MAKIISCRDVGMDCDFIAKGETEEDIHQNNREHHGVLSDVLPIGTHTDVLSRHYVDAVGSRWVSGWCPSLCLGGGRPGLGWSFLGDSSGRWGAASCGSRLGL